MKQNVKPRRRAQPVAAPPSWPRPAIVALVLLGFVVFFTSLQVVSVRRTSATFDEPGGLLAGYAALTMRDYRPAIEHPPLTRLWSALPLLFMSGVTSGELTKALDAARPESVAFQGPFATGHQFLYEDNDADRLLYRARFMNVVLGLVLGLLVFAWVGEWLGFRAAAIALGLYTVEPNIAAHSALATTDLGVACFIFGTLYFLWRLSRQQTAWNVAGLTVCFALAILSKFSAAVLAPLIVVVLGMLVGRGTMTARGAAALLALLAVAAWAAIWAAYGFRYAPSATPGWVFTLHDHPAVRQAVPTFAAIVAWVDGLRLLPNAFSEGFLHGQGLVQGRPAFLAGSYSTFGWWYYFPVAFVLKTPLALFALTAAGIVVIFKRGRLLSMEGEAFIVLPIVVFMGASMTSALNIGLRHILPIYPFVIMLAALAADHLRRSRPAHARGIVTALVVLAALEFATVYPNNLAFFNRLAGGPSNGYRYLADSNIDWGQDLKPLKAWMDRSSVAHINLAYFGVADPAYYGIDCTYLGGTTIPGVAPAKLAAPRLPGYVAVSTTLLDGVPFAERDRDFYKPLRDREPAADIGGSIKVYWVERPWWP